MLGEQAIASLMAVAGAVLLYFLPWLIARTRRHHNTTAIGLVNLLLGWTVAGWIYALIWSVMNPPPREKQHHPTRLVIALMALLALTGCTMPGADAWTRLGRSESDRDTAWQRCVNIHVWQHGFQEGTTGRRQYGYSPTTAVWNCMADSGYVWTPPQGLTQFQKAGTAPEARLDDYTHCFQRDPSFESWNNRYSQGQRIQNAASCMRDQGYAIVNP